MLTLNRRTIELADVVKCLQRLFRIVTEQNDECQKPVQKLRSLCFVERLHDIITFCLIDQITTAVRGSYSIRKADANFLYRDRKYSRWGRLIY